jgi:predicted membrane protein
MYSSGQNRTIGFGLLIIVIGFMVLLHQFSLIPENLDNIVFSWQMLLIVFGVYNLFYTQSRVFGYILIAVGGFFIIPEIFTLPYNFTRNFWPIILILVGLFIIFRHGFGKRESMVIKNVDTESHFIDEVNIFSGSEKKLAIKNFRGGKITSVFGGSEIDLSACELSDQTNIIEIFYMFGGSSITVPESWNVVNQVTAILGGFGDKRIHQESIDPTTSNTIILRGFVIFGGGEIKSR